MEPKIPEQAIGLNNADNIMAKFKSLGNEYLQEIRDTVTNPYKQKTERTWGVNAASKLIGVTTPTLRKYECNDGRLGPPSKDSKNKRVYSLEKINKYRDILGTRKKRPSGSEPIILSVSNFKGGSSKTTTSVHLAQKCAIEGFKTLLIDFDPQGTSTFICGGIIPDLEISYEDTIAPVLMNNPDGISEIIRETPFDGLHIIPGNLSLQDAELGLPAAGHNNEETLGNPAKRLDASLKTIKHQYDIIIIDCGPNLGILTLNAIIASNSLLVPIPPNMLDYASFVMFTGTLEKIFNTIGKSFDFFRILITKHTGTREANNVKSLIDNIYGSYVLTNYMCDTIEIAKAASDFGSVYEVTRPRGSRDAFRRAITHLDNVNNEIIGLFNRIWEVQSDKKVTDNIKEAATHV